MVVNLICPLLCCLSMLLNLNSSLMTCRKHRLILQSSLVFDLEPFSFYTHVDINPYIINIIIISSKRCPRFFSIPSNFPELILVTHIILQSCFLCVHYHHFSSNFPFKNLPLISVPIRLQVLMISTILDRVMNKVQGAHLS